MGGVGGGGGGGGGGGVFMINMEISARIGAAPYAPSSYDQYTVKHILL
jgi:hypothetical protein